MAVIEQSFHVDMCPDCGAVPFQHPMDAPWFCDHPRDRYVMVECAPTDNLRGAVDALCYIAMRPHADGTHPAQKARDALAAMGVEPTTSGGQ